MRQRPTQPDRSWPIQFGVAGLAAVNALLLIPAGFAVFGTGEEPPWIDVVSLLAWLAALATSVVLWWGPSTRLRPLCWIASIVFVLAAFVSFLPVAATAELNVGRIGDAMVGARAFPAVVLAAQLAMMGLFAAASANLGRARLTLLAPAVVGLINIAGEIWLNLYYLSDHMTVPAWLFDVVPWLREIEVFGWLACAVVLMLTNRQK